MPPFGLCPGLQRGERKAGVHWLEWCCSVSVSPWGLHLWGFQGYTSVNQSIRARLHMAGHPEESHPEGSGARERSDDGWRLGNRFPWSPHPSTPITQSSLVDKWPPSLPCPAVGSGGGSQGVPTMAGPRCSSGSSLAVQMRHPIIGSWWPFLLLLQLICVLVLNHKPVFCFLYRNSSTKCQLRFHKYWNFSFFQPESDFLLVKNIPFFLIEKDQKIEGIWGENPWQFQAYVKKVNPRLTSDEQSKCFSILLIFFYYDLW